MRKKTIVVVGILLTVLLAACGGAGDKAAVAEAPVSADAPSVAVATAVPATPTEAAVSLVDIPLDTLPRAFRYAGVDFAVTGGRLTNRSPIDPNQTVPGTLRVELTLEAKNLSGFTADIKNGTLRINFADGTAVEQVAVDSLANGATRAYTIKGNVQPTTTWDGATVTLSEADKEPLTVALTGAETLTGQAQPLASGGETDGLNKYAESIHFQVKDASLWDDGPQPGGYYIHAPLGRRFLMVTIQATNTGGQNGVSIYAEQFQVLADGVPFAVSYDVDGAQSVALNTSAEVTYYFLIPANTVKVQLVVVADADQPAQIPLTP
ncbi:MAG: hypothetical protein WHX52_19680 [Anaerolineae bacterium]